MTTLAISPLVPSGWTHPWQLYMLCYLIGIGVLTHLAAAWRGYKVCRKWIRRFLTPPRMPTGERTGAEDSENEVWQEPWDMDDTYEAMAWTPMDGIRHRRLESPGPTPWSDMIVRMNTEDHQELREPPSTMRTTERDTPSSMRSPGERRPRRRETEASERRNSPPLREAVRESGDMLWLVTRRLNSKDSWQL